MSSKQKVKALILEGRWDEAKLACAKLCQSRPKDADAWLIMGAVHGQFENFAEAEACSRRVVALNPAAAVGHFNLGITLQKQGKFAEAANSLRQAIKLNPNYAEAHNELGAALQLSGGELDAAVESYQRAIALNPSYAEAHYNLATAFRDKGLIPEAGIHFHAAVRLNPRMLKAQVEFLKLLVELGNLDEAYIGYQEALHHHPNEVGLYRQYGAMLITMGRMQEARQVYQRALELQPGDAKSYAGLARLMDREGDFEGGYALLHPLLQSDVLDEHVVLSYAVLAKHLGHQNQAMALLERTLNRDISSDARKLVHFALGKLYDESKAFDQAFAHFRSANDLDKSKFDLQQNAQMFADLRSVFSKTNNAQQLRAKNSSSVPVFIVGMPRSGTSLVEQILASHPDVYGAGELIDLYQVVKSLKINTGKSPYPFCLDCVEQWQIDELAERYLKKLADMSPQSLRVTDKLPHNFVNLGLIDRLFPGARVIHCMRDPIDTCLSIYSLPFNLFHLYKSNLEQLGAYYRQYQELMQYWKEVLRIPIMEIQYEELVANQEALSRKMIEFCGLEWDEQCLHFYASERKVKTLSYDQVRQPIYKKSMARWKNYESHLAPLINALGRHTGG